MKFYYDLHIHSDLSPCGSSDMTPNNIVNMSYIKGLNIISVTDHNTARNLPPVVMLGERAGIKVVPGIEVTTKEEVHVLCYFRNLIDALQFGDIIYSLLPEMVNNPIIFGEQNIYNELDEKTGSLGKLLLNAVSLSIGEVHNLAVSHHGIMVPAHINKKSNSILGVLGFIPKNLCIDLVEIYDKTAIDEKYVEGLRILRNSDAHQLIDISEAKNFFELDDIEDIYDYMNI
ncbi:PHP domain-containing protein [Sedimentibacter sp. B4]|uniref:PHP domain-containing protein n=1 Tax=Sedimentibacter sp. B4 TaxID=304766 RepID=UPI0003000B84|nr:PHP domain-containing protein [Sedimentibacter sp. B4]